MTLDGVEKPMEEFADAIEYQKEINQMLESRMTNHEEDAIQRELERMQREVVPEMMDVRVADLPVVPSTEPEEAVPVLEPGANIQSASPVALERLPLAA